MIVAPGSRAVAMNAGARLAQGDALLFLHADTTLPEGAGAAVREALRSADGGAFRLRYDERRPVLHLFGDLLARFVQPVYGDQAIFVTRAAFDRIGGFQPMPIMEDCDLVQRLRKHGRFTLLDLSVRTAARRHRAAGHGCHRRPGLGHQVPLPGRRLTRAAGAHLPSGAVRRRRRAMAQRR